jgi:hypothetical protein
MLSECHTVPQKDTLYTVIEKYLLTVTMIALPRQHFNGNFGRNILQQYNMVENSSIEIDVSSR